MHHQSPPDNIRQGREIALIILLALTLTGCDFRPAPLMPEPLSLGIPTQPSSALLFVALDRGLFRRHGIEVELKFYPSGKRALHEGLLSGAAEMIATADVPAAFAVFKRDDFRIVASLFNADNVNRVVARKDRGIRLPNDLKGKRIATQQASAVHFFLHLFLLEHAIAEQEIEHRFMKAEQLPKALAEDRIDAFSMREPYISETRELLGDKVVVFDAPGVYEQMEVLLASAELTQKRPEVVRRVLSALLETERFVQQSPATAAAIVARRLSISEDAAHALLPKYALRVELTQSLLLLLEDEARWALNNGFAEGDMPDYLHILAPDILAGIAPERVTVIR
ncbi:MAG: NrtA/SsuA/CpmA family ABC transporter substrate-binding protein [Candidatus Thiodiazotropha sp. (ex Dulcina madagascariensis)]|nr:NrtA/SsuA/CpmA family ABC transporter substrate-binding protein [Candidatus Thiodiazotropha sp. (ex Dulcina madagascariensis)]MCU7924876.1 NrtA/SsuA/CpmA family ABC transporter substrate-binding protein [Candidatus Thiodiazotropha sp. (ex Dulcina madagascariensis)]